MHPTQNPPVIVVFDDVALMMGEISPADVLRCAAIYIRLHGWYQDQFFGDEWATTRPLLTTPPACAIGAITMAVFGRPACNYSHDNVNWRLYRRATGAFDDYLTLTYPELLGASDDEDDVGYVRGDCWNDDPGRTADEVTTALDAAADYYESTHTPGGGAR